MIELGDGLGFALEAELELCVLREFGGQDLDGHASFQPRVPPPPHLPHPARPVLALTRQCNRVLIVHEDTRTGSIGESVAAIIQEEAFEYLDAPIRIIGALDTPVPYSPPLEEEFLPSEEQIERAARLLVAY